MSSWLKIVASWGPCGGGGVSVAAAAAQHCAPKLSITQNFSAAGGGGLSIKAPVERQRLITVKYEVMGIIVKQPPVVFFLFLG